MFKVGLLRYYVPFTLERVFKHRLGMPEGFSVAPRLIRDSFERAAAQKRIGPAPVKRVKPAQEPTRAVGFNSPQPTALERQLLRQPAVRSHLAASFKNNGAMPFSEMSRKMLLPVSTVSICQFAQKSLVLDRLKQQSQKTRLHRPFSKMWSKPPGSPLKQEF
ncbi:MAG: hypothetical protein K0Q50_169 [Vampirovibrio sp.]|nr:hypothetical protein [Vampirovibrio sp.]